MSDYRDIWNPSQGDERPVDDIDLDFYGQSYDSWDYKPGTPARGAGRNAMPPKPGKDPLADLDDDERDAFVKLRRWGKGPIYAAAEELGYTDINDVETMDEVNAWLKENYGDLFEDDEEEEEEREPFVPTPYEKKELDMGDFEAPEEMKIRKSGITVQNQPMKINKKPITGMNYGT